MRKLVVVLFVLKAVSVCAQTGPGTADTLIRISKGNYQLAYPSAWTLDTSKRFGTDMILFSPKGDSLDDFIENLNVFFQDLKGQNYTLLKMGQESEAQILNMITDVQLLESRLDSTAIPAHYVLKYKGRQGKFTLVTLQHFYLVNDTGYALTMTIQDGKEAEYISVAAKMIASFRVVPH